MEDSREESLLFPDGRMGPEDKGALCFPTALLLLKFFPSSWNVLPTTLHSDPAHWSLPGSDGTSSTKSSWISQVGVSFVSFFFFLILSVFAQEDLAADYWDDIDSVLLTSKFSI